MRLDKINGTEYSLGCKLNQLDYYSIKLNGEIFSIKEIATHYCDDLVKYKIVEVLPSIFLTACATFCVLISKYRMNSVLNIFRPSCQFTFSFRNKKDKWGIVQTHAKASNNFDNATYSNVAEGVSKIDPKLIPYPNSMGSGANRCVVWRIFKDLGLFSTHEEDYCFFTLSQIIKNVTDNKKLLSLCETQKPCGDLQKKFKNRTYHYKKDSDRDNIKVSLTNGVYGVSDGLHRICVAKRFGMKTIPVWLTEYQELAGEVNTPETEGSWFSCNNEGAQKIMRLYHSIFDNLGLEYDVGSVLVETSLDKLDIVSFLEKHTGKNIVELSETVSARDFFPKL